jgi:hypothetical protein
VTTPAKALVIQGVRAGHEQVDLHRRDDVHDVERRARPNRGDGGIAVSIEVGAQRFDESFGRRFVELDDHVDIVGGPRLAVQ